MTSDAPLIPVAIGGAVMAVRSLAYSYERIRYWSVFKRGLPDGALPLSLDGFAVPLKRELAASTFVVAVGTAGANRALAQLTLTANNHLSEHIGSVLVIENDTTQRRRFASHVPATFVDRLSYAACEDASGGNGNQSIPDALASIDEWGPEVLQATERALYTQLAHGSRAPGIVLVHLSMGGHAAYGLPAIKRLRERFGPRTLFLATVPLSIYEMQRARWAQLKALYESAGIAGWILSDNLSPDPTTLDYGLVALQVGLTDAAQHQDRAPSPLNALSLALAGTPGAVLAYEVVADYLASEPFPPPPLHPAVYYVTRPPLIAQLKRTLTALEEGNGLWSLDLPVYEKGAATFDVVLVNIRHQDLIGVADEVQAGRVLRETYQQKRGTKRRSPRLGDANYGCVFAATTAAINPRQPACPIVGVRFTQLRQNARLTAEIAKVPAKRALTRETPRALPTPRAKQLPAPRTRRAATDVEVTREQD